MSVWLAHAVMAFVAWGFLVPTSTAIATFRSLIFRGGSSSAPPWDRSRNLGGVEGRTWVNLHRHLNETAILLTWILCTLGFVAVPKGRHFRNGHQVVGLFIFLSTFVVWAMGRILMPPKKPRDVTAAETTTESTSLLQAKAGNDEPPSNSTSSSSSSPPSTVLVWAHRAYGIIISVAALWEMYSGISMYASFTGAAGTFYIRAYLIWCGFLVLAFSAFFILLLFSRAGT
jgi:hypothetical protein